MAGGAPCFVVERRALLQSQQGAAGLCILLRKPPTDDALTACAQTRTRQRAALMQ